ncbi:MAG: ABC transporter permease subunit [Pseudomonadota bacterium]
MRRPRRRDLPLLLAPGVGYLLVFFGVPLAAAILGSFGIFTIGAPSRPTFDHYAELFATRAIRDSIYFSVYLSVAQTILCLIISLPLAVMLDQKFHGRAIFRGLYKVPLVVPGIVAAFIVMTLFDRGGIAQRLLTPIGIALPKLVRDEWGLGIIIAMAWKNVPLMTLIVGGSIAAIPRDTLAAARTLGANRLWIFFLMQIPLALPGITAGTLLVFIDSMGAFAIPNLLGPIYPLTISVQMYESAFSENKWALTQAMGTVLSLVSIAVLLTYYAITRSARLAYAGGGR